MQYLYVMFKPLLHFLIFFLLHESVFGQEQKSSYYRYQVGIEAGPGKISAPGTRFPFCSSVGGFVRIQHHQAGFRRDYHTAFQIYVNADYYEFQNIYYGYAFDRKNSLIIPQAGIGYLDCRITRENTGQQYYDSFAAELSCDFILHARGNGAGARIFLNLNQERCYAGFIFHVLLGWSWNKKESREKGDP